MSPKLPRQILDEDNFIESSYYETEPDQWRPHGWKYRLAWIQKGTCRVLFDNHYGKADHYHVDDQEVPYEFTTIHQLRLDFIDLVKKHGGPV